MPINKPIIVEIAKSTWLIDQFGMGISYALLGEDKGLIIDAGSGLLNINDFAERLFKGKPYIVIYTHLDNSTAGGYKFIKANQYAHPNELLNIDSISPNIDNNVSVSLPKYSFVSGHIEAIDFSQDIDLGKRIIKLIFTPGVSKGNISLFDENNKIMFSGNVLNYDLKLSSFVSDEFVSLQTIKYLKPARIFPSFLSMGNYCSFKSDLLDEAISCVHIALHPSGKAYLINNSNNVYRVNRITMTINKDKIWHDYESNSPYPIGI